MDFKPVTRDEWNILDVLLTMPNPKAGETHEYIGPARNGALLEVLTIPTIEGSELATHSMRMRPKYRRLLSEQ